MTQYIYLDDESKDSVEPFIDAVSEYDDDLNIEHFPPLGHSDQLTNLKNYEREGRIDGLILDLRLDQISNGGVRADYRASTLAQEIRTRATERRLKEYPIVLWSTDEKLNQSYVKDDTSHDLFDLKAVKGHMLDPEKARTFANKLVALADGYKQIIARRPNVRGKTFKFLGLNEMPSFLDPLILAPIDDRNGVLPAHEYSRFIVRELLGMAGPIVDKNHLAARLGLDLQSSPDIQKLLDKYFATAQYKGPFAKGWPTWWMALVDDCWRKLPNSPGSLRNLDSDTKLKFLKKLSGFKGLAVATTQLPIESSKFWTVCQATLKPLDPKDGYLIDRQPSYPWQEKLYVSTSALMDGIAENKRIKLDPIERERFNRTVQLLSKK